MADPRPALEQALSAALPGRVSTEPGPRPADLTVRLTRGDDVPAAVGELRAGGLVLGMLVATDERGRGGGLEVRYVFEPGEEIERPLPDLFVTLVAPLDPDRPRVPSISGPVPSASWHEREAHDLFGIEFEGHPDPRPLVLHDGWPEGTFPLRKSFDGRQTVARVPAEEFPHLLVEGLGVFEVPVGPIHAGIIEPGHFRFSTIGESVLNLEPRLFYTHRGLEKRMEGLTIDDAFAIAERVCGVCSLSHGLGFCEAFERLAGLEVPARARFLRTVALELERLYNHAGDIGNIAAGASYHYGTSNGARIKEALQQANEQLTGHRFLRGLVVPGGVRLDLTPELARSTEQALTVAEEALHSLVARIEDNPSVLDRLDDTGELARQVAIDLGATGVAARASGVDRDARRDHPHGAYGPGGPVVRVASSSEGDVHARVTVRAAEAFESIRLIRELLGGVPSGALCASRPAALPPWASGLSAIESPRGAALHFLRVDGAGRVDRYHLRSASFANWPLLPIAAQTGLIPDFPLINKSFELCYSCTDR